MQQFDILENLNRMNDLTDGVIIRVEPDVILMDEPTSALGPISMAEIEDLIDELKNNYISGRFG